MANEQMQKEPVSVWLAESLRLTVFLTPGAVVGDSTWEDLVGKPPETSVRRPAYQDEGEFEDGRLTLATQPSRVDWLYAADLRKIESGLPTVGSFPDAVSKFQQLMYRWLKECPPITRIAFGAILLQPVGNRIEGYKRIVDYLPSVKLDGENSSEFAYQINRPRVSNNIDALQINRLSKWSVMEMQRLQFVIPAEQVAIVQPAAPGEKRSACRLELDINTSPAFAGEFPKEKLFPVFDELIALGKEIAERGDVQ